MAFAWCPATPGNQEAPGPLHGLAPSLVFCHRGLFPCVPSRGFKSFNHPNSPECGVTETVTSVNHVALTSLENWGHVLPHTSLLRSSERQHTAPKLSDFMSWYGPQMMTFFH